jgi:hypothetical protein
MTPSSTPSLFWTTDAPQYEGFYWMLLEKDGVQSLAIAHMFKREDRHDKWWLRLGGEGHVYRWEECWRSKEPVTPPEGWGTLPLLEG